MQINRVDLWGLSLWLVFISVVSVGFAQQKRTVGDPLEHLPQNIEKLTFFGERADISPDNKKVAFMAKTFGDAMVIDLETRVITCLTCNVPAAAFLRVMYLPDGNFLLMGPDHFENPQVSRLRDSELWYLKNERGAKPIKINQKVSEGFALSKKNMKIAYTHIKSNAPGRVRRELIVADLDFSGDTPRLVQKKTVYKSTDQDCVIEAQDFYDHDDKLVFFCYVPKGISSVMSLDLRNGEVRKLTHDPKTHTEPEGIFPDGQYIAVEADRQCDWLGGSRGPDNIDIWKLKLDGKGTDMTRLTHFNDYEGSKASNPVVSHNGKFMAFQSARSSDPPGVGYGILIYWLDANNRENP